MTLICVDAQPDHATIVADGLAYDPFGMRFWQYPKTPKVLERIDAAVTSGGSVRRGRFWQDRMAPELAAKMADFDEFVSHVGPALEAVVGDTTDTTDLQAFMVGYSPARQRFVGYIAWPGLGTGWTPQPFTGLHLNPAPKGTQPTAAENAWLINHGADPLPDGQPLVSPQSIDEWRALIRWAFRERALADPYAGDGTPKRLFGGDITLTRVELGRAASGVIDRLADDPDDIRKMLRYTLHPLGQVGPCECLSGERMVDCCIGRIVDSPCLCESGSTFGECHKVCPCGSESPFGDCCKVDVDTAELTAA